MDSMLSPIGPSFCQPREFLGQIKGRRRRRMHSKFLWPVGIWDIVLLSSLRADGYPWGGETATLP